MFGFTIEVVAATGIIDADVFSDAEDSIIAEAEALEYAMGKHEGFSAKVLRTFDVATDESGAVLENDLF